TPYTPACKDFSEFCFNDREYSEIEIRLYSIALKHGFLVSKHPRITSNYCGAVTLNSHVIDPSGLLYKCWDTIGMEEESVGNINQLHTTLNSNVFKWLLWDPFEFEKCKNCDVLPICLGGCPYRALYVKPFPHPKCDSWKYNLKDMLELIYLSKLKSSDNKKISTET
ncbi:MAG: SPASM domain-containing protein, partial [Candidatus Methanofastidiosia archaeon]